MKVLLVDDDRDLVDLLRYAFQRDGHKVVMAFDGEMAMRTFETEAPDLVVLDLTMPKRSGMEVLQEIRRRSQVPILILTAAGEEDRLVSAFELGADDYLVKPFRPRELRARTRAIARRAQEQSTTKIKQVKPITLGSISLNPGTREVRREGQVIQLTAKEFALLHYLMLNHDVVLSTSEIVANVWGFESSENEEVVKVTVYRLRQKIEPDCSNPQYIFNVPGYGYRFEYKAAE